MKHLMFRTPSPTDRLGRRVPYCSDQLSSRLGRSSDQCVCVSGNCVFRSLYHRGMISPGTLVLLSAFPTPREAPFSSWGNQREKRKANSEKRKANSEK